MSDLENKKKNRRIFHPIFVAIFPILIIYSQNVGRVNVEDLILPVVIVSLFSVSVYYILKFILIEICTFFMFFVIARPT